MSPPVAAAVADLVQSLVPEMTSGIDARFILSPRLGGTLFGHHPLDDDHLALYLLDVSGHGIESELLAVSISHAIVRRSARLDFREPGQVVSWLNDLFPMDRHHNKYFTLVYAVFRRPDRTLAYCNAGHPDALLHTGPDAATATLLPLPSTDPVVGMLPEGTAFETRRVPLGRYARLLLHSDGVFEIERPDGRMWQHHEFIAHVAALLPDGGPLADRLLGEALRQAGSDRLADDFAILDARL